MKLLIFAIYPLILMSIFYKFYQIDELKKIIKNKYKIILINTLIFILFTTVLVFIYFKFEDKIYQRDYSGYWVKSLEFKQILNTNPLDIFNKLYNSMLHYDYTYLPNLYLVFLMNFFSSFKSFVLSIALTFIAPLTVIIQLIYFTFNKKDNFYHNHLIIVIMIIFYPLYFNILNGNVDVVGLIFIASLFLISFYDQEGLFINFLVFNLIFLRRWYLFYVVAYYIYLFIKTIININKNSLIKFLKTFIPLTIVLIIFFNPYLIRLFTNNFKEAYEFYNQPNKLMNLINFYSPIISIITIISIYYLKNKKNLILFFVVTTIIPYILIARIQSLGFHHYHLMNLNILIILIIFFLNIKKISYILLVILSVQSLLIYQEIKIPLFTQIKKIPEIMEYKKDIQNLTNYLETISSEEWQSSYIASGDYNFNDDLIRNANLPVLTNRVKIESNVLDLRDGFPKDLKHINYVLITKPTLYLNQKYQKTYDIITNAILNEKLFSDTYQKIKEFKINGVDVLIYERVKDLSYEQKLYFYNEMIKHYPNHQDYFKYILD